MPAVLIAGCGYLGRATSDLFRDAGWRIEAWTKSDPSAEKLSSENYTVAAVDIGDRSQVIGRTGEFNVVIHCASTRGGDVDAYRNVYLNGASNLLDRFTGSTMILIGSTSVYAQKEGEWVTELSAAEPEHERGKILCAAEQQVLKRGGIVARLAGIYGPGRSHMLERLLAGDAILDLHNDRFVNQVHRDDAADALLILANRARELGGEIFNLVDNQPMLQSECYRWLSQKLKRSPPVHGDAKSTGKRGRSNKRVSNAKLRGLGWLPKFPTFADAMEKSILSSFAVTVANR